MARVGPALGVGVVVAALPALAGLALRAKATDAGRSKRLVPIRGHGRSAGRDYLEFDPEGFASHPGRLSMRAATGGELLVLSPATAGDPLRRTVERGDAARVIAEGEGQLSGHLGETPADFGFRYEDVTIQELPAWVIPAPEPTDGPRDAGDSGNAGTGDAGTAGVWVIHVHGLGSSRSQCLRGVEAFAGLGCTSLLPSYRTSLDVSPEPGRSHLGVSEWRDIEAARRYALARGARRILFVGWSLGASIVLRTVSHARDGSTAGVVLVAPALDWPAILSAQLHRNGVPKVLAKWLPHTVNLVRRKGDPVIRWKEMPGTSMQNHPDIPTMIFHGTDDNSVPVELSRRFVSRQNRPVQLVEFEGAHHTLEWNAAPQLWNQSVRTWCRPLGLNASEDFIDHISEAK
ncbi:alpha/beta fold hydrolase [Arthrobacter sp. zg-Y820]|uniref:alpha/beta hydrolase family protein n=1 Tax=unclassified Arthrobacter TaxID=235627 RepID=UPI001E38F600|nr:MULTISPECIES: alpha/beta fold hydrolase [unclassified Arthrobacter]MCC9195653.1 alpha/beta hydrolase [Arthrobacter sp. zg-Y820]MDK1278512.1 alpha/beta fold hydrolase [Arthrobacter sp. zg.Y820]WIB09052.1 alpha/beta fold hydrolase [Arthrobacter sp. zg-Y820]